MEKLSSVPALCTPINYDDLAKCKGKHDEIFEMISSKGLVSMKDLWELDGDHEKEKAISFYNIKNFASRLPLADSLAHPSCLLVDLGVIFIVIVLDYLDHGNTIANKMQLVVETLHSSHAVHLNSLVVRS
jgi:hypothetical protein